MLWWRLERKTTVKTYNTFTFASIATILHVWHQFLKGSFKSWVSRQSLFAGSSWPKAQYSSIQLNTDCFTRRLSLWCLRSNATQRFGSVDAGGQSTLPTWCCIGKFLACKALDQNLKRMDQILSLSVNSFHLQNSTILLALSTSVVHRRMDHHGSFRRLSTSHKGGHRDILQVSVKNLCLYPIDLAVVKSVKFDKNVRRWTNLWISLLHLFLLCSSLFYRLRLAEARNCQTTSSSGWTWFWDLLLKCPRMIVMYLMYL